MVNNIKPTLSFAPVSTSAVFCLLLLVFLSLGPGMVSDPDLFWHMAAGDWIRAHHQLPASDPWSYTAGAYPWMNICWAWDALLSYIHEIHGWQGAIALNATTLALAFSISFRTAQARAQDGFSALLSVMIALPMLIISIRPMQFSYLMIALWMWLLGAILRKQAPMAWLAAIPITTVLWVNVHGGFIIAPVLLGAYFVQAWLQGERRLAAVMALAGLVSLGAALALNPYGTNLIQAAWQTLTGAATASIGEWQPMKISLGNLLTHIYALLFIALVPRRSLPVFAAERWLAYGWLLMALTSQRYFPIFAVISLPVFACALRQALGKQQRAPLEGAARFYEAALAMGHYKTTRLGALIIAATLGLASFTPAAAKLHSKPLALPSLASEIAFLREHHPKARLFNHYNLGGILVYEAPDLQPFIDGRAETAYPPAVIAEYLQFLSAAPGWEKIFDHYHIDVVMMPLELPLAVDRFAQRKGWKEAYRGPMAAIFVKEKR